MGTVGDVLDIQEKVSRAIVEALRLRLTEHEDRRLARRPAPDFAVFDCYLRARAAINEFTGDGVERAIVLLQDGLEKSGPSPALLAGLALALFQRANVTPQMEGDFVEARRKAEAALQLDPDSPQAHLVLGLVLMTLWWLAMAYANYAGRGGAALPLAERLADIDPLNRLAVAVTGVVHFCDGRFGAGAEVFRRAFPVVRLPIERGWLSVALAYAGQGDEALALLEPVGAAPGRDVWTSLGVLLRQTLRGERDRVREVLTPEFTALARRGPHFSWQVGSLLARLDEREPVLDWLENAVSRGYVNYPLPALLRSVPGAAPLAPALRAADAPGQAGVGGVRGLMPGLSGSRGTSGGSRPGT